MSTLLLIDGLSLAYRAFYALPADLATPEGTVTNAVFGFTSMLVKVLGDEHPDGIAVVFDAPGKNFRHELDATVSGVSENQNVPDAATWNRSFRNRIAEYSPAVFPSSRPTPTTA